MAKAFEFDDEPAPVARRNNPERGWWSAWLLQASSIAAGVVVAGLILGLAFRAYVYWSVTDSVKKMNEQRDTRH